jgi:hypothetical protein
VPRRSKHPLSTGHTRCGRILRGQFAIRPHNFLLAFKMTAVESLLFVGDQCSWNSLVTFTHEFTSPRTCFYFLFDLCKCCPDFIIYLLPMKLRPPEMNTILQSLPRVIVRTSLIPLSMSQNRQIYTTGK